MLHLSKELLFLLSASSTDSHRPIKHPNSHPHLPSFYSLWGRKDNHYFLLSKKISNFFLNPSRYPANLKISASLKNIFLSLPPCQTPPTFINPLNINYINPIYPKNPTLYIHLTFIILQRFNHYVVAKIPYSGYSTKM